MDCNSPVTWVVTVLALQQTRDHCRLHLGQLGNRSQYYQCTDCYLDLIPSFVSKFDKSCHPTCNSHDFENVFVGVDSVGSLVAFNVEPTCRQSMMNCQ